jgi:hypothetical protein
MDAVQTIIHRHNDGKGTLTFERVQDCTAIAEAAKQQQNYGVTGTSEMKLAARLPLVMVEAYLNNNNITMNEFLVNREHIKRMCEDPALAHFRVWKGKL